VVKSWGSGQQLGCSFLLLSYMSMQPKGFGSLSMVMRFACSVCSFLTSMTSMPMSKLPLASNRSLASWSCALPLPLPLR
jgi:hypothetical protein